MPTYQPKILVVEDESLVAADLRMSLSRLGYEISGIADTGLKALQIANDMRPDLVLMDIRLRGAMNGITAASRIRENCHIPVVFVTANTSDDVVAEARAACPYGFLTKPFRIEELNATIRIALEQHGRTRDLFAKRKWLETTLDSLSNGIIATDAEGYVLYLNPAAQVLTGWTRSEAVGKLIEEICLLTTLDESPLEHCQVRKALLLKQPVGKVRLLLKNRLGQKIPLEDSAAPIIEDGEITGAVTVFLDISDRLLLERNQATESHRLKEKVESTNEALGQTRTELRALSRHLMTAQEEERRRVARELHDDLGQRTALLSYDVDRLSGMLSNAPPDAQTAIEQIRARLVELAQGLRQVSHRLHPSILADIGLTAALRSLVDEYQNQGLELSAGIRGIPGDLPLEVSTALYRIAQESLRNVSKHTADVPVRLTLCCQNDQLELRIEDTGAGFDLEQVRANGGLGLLSMQERALSVGGKLMIRSCPGDGTNIMVRVPLPAN